MKAVWYRHKGKHTDAGNMREVIPHIHGQLVFQGNSTGKENLFNVVLSPAKSRKNKRIYDGLTSSFVLRLMSRAQPRKRCACALHPSAQGGDTAGWDVGCTHASAWWELHPLPPDKIPELGPWSLSSGLSTLSAKKKAFLCFWTRPRLLQSHTGQEDPCWEPTLKVQRLAGYLCGKKWNSTLIPRYAQKLIQNVS